MVQVQANNGGVWMGAQDVPQRKSEDAEGRLYVWFVDAAHKRDKKLLVARRTAKIVGIIPCRVVQLLFGVDRRHDEIKTMAVVTDRAQQVSPRQVSQDLHRSFGVTRFDHNFYQLPRNVSSTIHRALSSQPLACLQDFKGGAMMKSLLERCQRCRRYVLFPKNPCAPPPWSLSPQRRSGLP